MSPEPQRLPRPTLPAEGGLEAAAEKHEERSGTALCLSGGGYRAALFHLGALRRLNERGVLSAVDTLSTVSGGSIIGAALYKHLADWGQPGQPVAKFDDVVEEIYRATSRNIRTWPVLKGALPWHWTPGAVGGLEHAYADGVAGGLDLGALHDGPGRRPRWYVCATELYFGECFWFDSGGAPGRWQVGSPTPGYGQPDHQVPVARAVAASSCFPPVFHPMPISALGHLELRDGRLPDGPARDAALERMSLTDGGVFDNLGVTPVWDSYEHLLVSNGGAVFEPQRQYDPLGRLLRYIAVTGNGGEWMRTKIIRENDRAGRFDGALWDIADELVGADADYPPNVVENRISNVRTDLDMFSPVEQGALENRGYAVAESALVRQLARPHALSMRAAPFALPHPDVDEAAVEREMADSHERTLPGRGLWSGR